MNDKYLSSSVTSYKELKASDKTLSSSNELSLIYETNSYYVGDIQYVKTYFYQVATYTFVTYCSEEAYATEVRLHPTGTNAFTGNAYVTWGRTCFGTLSDIFSSEAQLGRTLGASTDSVFVYINDHTPIGLYIGAMINCYALTKFISDDSTSLIGTPKIDYYQGYDVTVTSYFTKDAYEDSTADAVYQQTVILEEQLETDKANLEEQQKQTEQMEEQTETQKGIFASITDFFGGFFDNLINSIIGIFVPSSDEMSELFDELNNFFSDTFGFLYYPFEFLIKAFDALMTDSSDTALTLPGFSIMGYEIWSEQKFDISTLGVAVDVFKYVRIGTGAFLALAFVNYLRDFFDKRFGGGGQ